MAWYRYVDWTFVGGWAIALSLWAFVAVAG